MSAEAPGEALVFKVLGRTLEHFGVQMYKRRETAIAELVANCWDAGAHEVRVLIPESAGYDHKTSVICIQDDGRGMTFDQVRDRYLILGRNRRKEENALVVDGRPVMGRKGIGKLAGFGLGRIMTVTTWSDGSAMRFTLDMEKLKLADNQAADIPIPWEPCEPGTSSSGTEVTLQDLKHVTPIERDSLAISIARRFSRRIKGEMTILLNGDPLPDPTPPLDKREPADTDAMHTAELSDGNTVTYWFGFAGDVIKSRELRGFTIHVNGKTAQAPPFFFDVEATATGQHSTRYVIGEIEADFIDTGLDDETDRVSTDRQELDWDEATLLPLRSWGQELSRKALAECRDFKGVKVEETALNNAALKQRIEQLEKQSQAQVRTFLRQLGPVEDNPDRILELADSLVRAYEFRHFHDVLGDIETAAEDPDKLKELLSNLRDWKVLESRAILEIVNGRLQIIDKFQLMLADDAPETAHNIGDDNMHDLIGRFPWLLNPEWQVLDEEKQLTKQLREWGTADIPDPEDRRRYDFLALSDLRRLVVIEMKRPGHAVEATDLTRLIEYRERLARADDRPELMMVMLHGGQVNVSEDEQRNWETAPDRELRKWSRVFEKSRVQYEHYRAVLTGDVTSGAFTEAKRDVAQARQVIAADSTFRGIALRKEGLGTQDVDYKKPAE